MAVGQNSYVTHMKQHLPFVLMGVSYSQQYFSFLFHDLLHVFAVVS